MAQDTGLFSVRRPRETLGPISNNITAIPMPSSAMKRSNAAAFGQISLTATHARSTSGSRMSLAPSKPTQPTFRRSSSAGNFAEMGFSTVQRPSTQNHFAQMTSGRKSLAPMISTPGNLLQLQENTQRRSSVYNARPSAGFGSGVGHSSFFATAPPTSTVPTDPRRLRDINTKTQMGHELMEFLSQRLFENKMKHTLSHKTMKEPTQKDFINMFQFLYHQIDPNYRFQKSIDAEVHPLLKQLRYPFEKNISKSGLAAVGGNNWSTFLGLLHWMMQLAKMMEQYSDGVWDDACVDAGFDVNTDRITFEFLSGAYREWLSIEDDGDDDDEEKAEAEAKRRIQPHVDAMAANFERANAENLEREKELEAEARILQDQIDELEKMGQRLTEAHHNHKVLEEDREKFELFNTRMEERAEKQRHRIDVLQQECERCDAKISEYEQERDELQGKIDQKGFGTQDIDSLNVNRNKLQKEVDEAEQRLKESRERTAKKEEETSNLLEDLQRTVEQYNGLGYQVGVVPSTAHNAHGFEYEVKLNLTPGPDFTISQGGLSRSDALGLSDHLLSDRYNGYQPQHLLPKVDFELNGRRLKELRGTIAERRNAAAKENGSKVEILDEAREALEEKKEEIEKLKHQSRIAQEEFSRLKETSSAQNIASAAEIEKIEREISVMRGGGESVQVLEQREINMKLEYEQMTVTAGQVCSELYAKLGEVLEDVLALDLHVHEELGRYEKRVMDELDCENAESIGGSSWQ